MSAKSAAADNPFPGLRPFEPHESALFFGRDEQCDDLLTRLARRRLVAVVGMSGSGKSSLVRAGLLPALDRGYMPSTGSSWHVAIFRPGSQPLENLARALATRRRPDDSLAKDNLGEIRTLLDSSSVGLAAAARPMLTDRHDSLVVVADQFEEIFRFGQIAQGRDAQEEAAACIDLLVNASTQDEVPVYVVITMRSDYLGDCAHFTGLPEALNDSQFLVPKMTRAQLRAAIECPIAVRGGQISPRLVQRLLHDVDQVSSSGNGAPRTADQFYQDQLPVLQHALMRLWEVSRPARESGEAIDLLHYEQPPVETLRHALDRHAEEVYGALATDEHRRLARHMFQRLTDRDAENREVRRPTALTELSSVALRRPARAATPTQVAMVNDVVAAFAAEGRAFVVINAQQDVDISHESFIRHWERLGRWVEQENRSGRIYTKLSDAAIRWSRNEASLYRGPELVEARRWWDEETPTADWANRYGSGFPTAERFLKKSSAWRRLRLGLLFGNAALLVIAAVAIAVLLVVSRNEAKRAEEQAKRAEAAAVDARNAAVEREQANSNLAKALKDISDFKESTRGQPGTGNDAENKQLRAELEAKVRQAQLEVEQAKKGQVLTSTEISDLNRLRKQEAAWKTTEEDLRIRLAAAQRAAETPRPDQTPTGPAGADRNDLERLRKAEGGWEQEKSQLQQQVATFRDQVAIRNVLESFAAAYSMKDLKAMARWYPSIDGGSYEGGFASFAALDWRNLSTDISISGSEATASAQVRISRIPLERRSSPPVEVSNRRFTLRRSQSGWTIVDLK